MESLVLAGMVLFLIVLIMGKEYLNSRSFRKQNLEKIYQSYGTLSERKYKAGEIEHIQKYYLLQCCRRRISVLQAAHAILQSA